MCMDVIKLHIIHSRQNVVIAPVVNTSTSFSFSLVCVYGDPYYRKNKDLWKLIEHFVASLGILVSHWVCVYIVCGF